MKRDSCVAVSLLSRVFLDFQMLVTKVANAHQAIAQLRPELGHSPFEHCCDFLLRTALQVWDPSQPQADSEREPKREELPA